MFKFYHRTDANGVERIYMFPEDVIKNSIIALNTFSATTATGYTQRAAGGPLPGAGQRPRLRHLRGDRVPGYDDHPVHHGPGLLQDGPELRQAHRRWAGRRTSSGVWTSSTCSIRSTSRRPPHEAARVTNWQVTSAATDVNASQDPGGRITQFGLRFNW